jgi:hypothetical protein
LAGITADGSILHEERPVYLVSWASCNPMPDGMMTTAMRAALDLET